MGAVAQAASSQSGVGIFILRRAARSLDVLGGAALSPADLSLAALTLAALRPVTLTGHATLRRPLARPDLSGADPCWGASSDARPPWSGAVPRTSPPDTISSVSSCCLASSATFSGLPAAAELPGGWSGGRTAPTVDGPRPAGH